MILAKRVASRWLQERLRSPLRKVAETRKDILRGLDKDIEKRAKGVTAKLKRSMPSNGIWLFRASSRGDTYTVTVKADPSSSRITKLVSSDLLVKCTCPYWQYGGPEYHAKKKGYLYKSPEGTASKPKQMDPDSNNYVCKHAYAVLQKIDNYRIRR